MAQTPRFGLLLIAADEYAAPPGRLPSSTSARRLRDLLVARGGAAAEPIVVTRKDEVWNALGQWARRAEEPPASSFVYLVGHGQSDGETHWFTLPETHGAPGADNAIPTSMLADLLLTEWQHRQTSPSSWVVVVLDCCASEVGVTNLMNQLTKSSFRRPRRLELWPVTPQGASHSGRFVDVLGRYLDTFTENDEGIPLRELIRRMGPELGGLEPDGSLPDDATLENPRRAAATVTMTLDAYAELRQVVAALPTEVRSHFLAKAQGAEVGELAWHFCGRDQELASLSSWLRDTDHGLRVVTGEAGSGKSALLGHLVVLANEELVTALSRADLLRPPPLAARPPAGTFDAVVHLTGKTLTETVREVAEATGVAPALEDALDADAVLAKLGADPRRLTILADALDEAQEPKAIANFLRRASAADRVRVLAGTRRSLDEGPDRAADPGRRELLDALDASDADLVVVSRDAVATGEYVRRRLLADGSPYARRDDVVAAIAEQIAGRDQPFLFTRLATAELLARPAFAPDDPALAELLAGGHRGVFAAAVNRLGAEDPAIAALLHALALARGRGFPEASGIWAAAARAIAPDGIAVPDGAVRAALERAAVYITLDGEAGQSTYRLAHQTFVEHFRAGAAAESAHHRVIAAALRQLVERDGGWATANYYVVRYLAEHYVADADRVRPDDIGLAGMATDAGWLRRALALLGADRLADVLAVANRAVPSFSVDAVARAVRRSRVAISNDPDQLAAQLYARLKRERDPSIAGLIARLDEVAPDTWLRSRAWGLPWRADLDTTYTLVGTVRALAFGALDGHTMLAIGVDDRVVFWNPRRGSAEARGFSNDGRRVTALALTELAGRPIAVVAAGYDLQLTLVDLQSGQRREAVLPAYSDSVAVGTLGGREVVAAAGYGRVWAWDAATLEPLAVDDHTREIEGVLAIARRLAFHTSSNAAGVVLSSVVDAASGRELWRQEHEEIVRPPGRASTEVGELLVTAARSARSGPVDVWQMGAKNSYLDSLSFDETPLRTLAMGTVDGRLVVAAAADYPGSGFISLRQVSGEPRDAPPSLPRPRLPIFSLLAAPNGSVQALMSLRLEVVELLPSRDVSIAGSDDNPTPQVVTRVLVGHDAPLTFSTDASDGKQRLLNLGDLGVPRTKPRRKADASRKFRRDRPLEWPATATTYASVGGRAVLAVGSYGGAVWLWDLEQRSLLGGPFAKIRDVRKKKARGSAPVTSVAIGPVDERDVVATAYDGRVGLWDIATQAPLPSPDTGTTRVVTVALGTLAGRAALVTGSEGGMLTVWDAARSERMASIRLDTRIDGVWVVRGAEIVGALTEDRVLHLFDVVSRRRSPGAAGE